MDGSQNLKAKPANVKAGMYFPFALKLGLAISLLAVLSTGGSVYYVFQEGRALVLEQMRNRLKDIGRSGAYLFNNKLREDLKYLRDQSYLHSSFSRSPEQQKLLLGEDGIALTDDDSTYESIRPEISAELMATRSFQRVVQAMRQIREGSRQNIRSLRKVPPLHVLRKNSDDLPTLEYIYLLVPVKGFASSQYIMYLADSDYLPVDDDGTGEPYEGNPIGNISFTLTPEMGMGFAGSAIAEEDFTEDQWGDVVISGYVPILDKKNQVICVLGMDYNVKSEANKIATLGRICISVVVAVFLLAACFAYLLSRWFHRPIAILKEGAQRVAQRDFKTRVKVVSKDELGHLAYAFNTMVTEIDSYAASLKDLNTAFERFRAS